MIDYDQIYRLTRAKTPICPLEKTPQLSDLWPSLQEDFRRTVDATVAHLEDEG